MSVQENNTQEKYMARRISVTAVEAVPADERICHYDELDERAKEQFPDLVSGDANSVEADVDQRTATELAACSLVKYTEYYRVQMH